MDPNAATVAAVRGGTVTDLGGAYRLAVGQGTLDADTRFTLTPVTAQALAGVPPRGWSPIVTADLAPHGVAFSSPAQLTMPLPPGQSINAVAVAVRWDAPMGEWLALGQVTLNPAQAQVVVPIDQSGQVALLLPDAPPGGPPLPAAGEPLAGSTDLPVPDGVSAAIQPTPRVLFTAPGVRAAVRVQLTSTLPVASGAPLRLQVREAFQLSGGRSLYPEPAAQDLLVFAYPGTALHPAGELTLAPSVIVQPHELRLGTIDLAVQAHQPITQGVLVGANGATVVAAPGITLTVPRRGAAAVPVGLVQLAATEFAPALPTGYRFVQGVYVDLHGAAFDLPATLAVAAPADLGAGDQLLVVRRVAVGGVSQLQLIGPASLAAGRLSVFGVREEGAYGFLAAATPQGFVTGAVTGATGLTVAGAIATSSGSPFVSLTNPDGRYTVAAPVGLVTVSVREPKTHDVVTALATVTGPGSFTTLNIALASTTPAVQATWPSADMRQVPLESTLLVTFTEPLNPASVTTEAFMLFSPAGRVAGVITLAPDGQSLTFVPGALLASQTAFTATVSGAVADLTGNQLGSDFSFHFQTIDLTPPPPPAPGLIQATIPDANAVSQVTGSPGTVEPGGAVIIRNLRTAALTTIGPGTIGADGSFSAQVPALRSDKLEITLQDTAGNTMTVPAPRFENPDGSTVVGAEGGVVVGSDGAFVEAPPGALADGTVVKITPLTGTLPVTMPANFQAVGAVNLHLDGVVSPTHYLDLGLPAPPDAQPTDVVLVVTPARTAHREAWSVIDRAHLENGRYVTASPPFPGVGGEGTFGFFKASNIIAAGPNGTLDTSTAGDDIRARRDVFGVVVMAGPNGRLDSTVQGDDQVRPDCVSFVSSKVVFGLGVTVATFVGINKDFPFLYPVATEGPTTIASYCNEAVNVQVVDPGTDEVLMEVTRVAPPVSDQIEADPTVLTDDNMPPSVTAAVFPTRLDEESQAVSLWFSEPMDSGSLSSGIVVRDSGDVDVPGVIETFANVTVAVFQPYIPFRLGERYRVLLAGVRDRAGNAYAGDPLAFTRAAPSSLGKFTSPEMFAKMARCATSVTGATSCDINARDMAVVSDTLFIANGQRMLGETYYWDDPLTNMAPARLAVVDIHDPAQPRLLGWHPTTTDPSALAVVRDVSFPYQLPGGQQAQFTGHLLVVVGGGRGNTRAIDSKLEVYDITDCMQRVAGENCLDEPLLNADNNSRYIHLKGMKFLSTAIGEVQRLGVPPDPGVVKEVVVLHQPLTTLNNGVPQRVDTVMAYAVVVPIGLEAIDITKAFNLESTAQDRFGIDGLVRGNFFDVRLLKTQVVATEQLANGQWLLDQLSARLQSLATIPVPRAFRAAAGANFVFDIDRDGNLGFGEDADGDALQGVDELFDLAVVASGGRTTAEGAGELYVVDLSNKTNLQHREPLQGLYNVANARIVSRIPLPGPAMGVCVDAARQLAYVNLREHGWAIVDLSHLLPVMHHELTQADFIDSNSDGLDDRILYIHKDLSNPSQEIIRSPCLEGDVVFLPYDIGAPEVWCCVPLRSKLQRLWSSKARSTTSIARSALRARICASFSPMRPA